MDAAKPYVCKDEHGVLRVAQTRVMLDSVVIAFGQGHSAETISQQYSALTLEEVYGAITYYLAHKQEVEDYLRRQEEVWRRSREQAASSANPVVQRLRNQATNAEIDAG